MGSGIRWFQTELEKPDSIPTSTNHSNSKSIQQGNQRSSSSSTGCSKLGSATLVAVIPKYGSKPSSSREVRRCSSPGRAHEKTETSSPTRRSIGSKDYVNKGEEIFYEIIRQRRLSDDAIKNTIKGLGRTWRDLRLIQDPESEIVKYVTHLQQNGSTSNNIVESVAALALLFKVSGFKEVPTQGKELYQIMKKHRAAIKKVQKEESINSLDNLLKVLENQAKKIDDLAENASMGCIIVSIMIFSVLRLAEVMRASVEQAENGSWMINTSTQKGEDGGVIVHFRKSRHIYTSPVFWLSTWINKCRCRLIQNNLWYLTKTNKPATVNQGSKAVHEIMKLANIDISYTVTSIRSSSITKQIAIGATKQQVNRFTRHKKGPATMARFYDKNTNDELKERLATFKRRSLANKKVNS
ncbi:MAG: hypothetical protein EZS28_007757 [Streblomastix strix]|uniref:Tyr recombinase domain-containing protein n=1 Tax=Streblomastix strix TaxID=222440 RepID=A0A5J4WP32_9EUKA|nr:MAG: hypothetical protein EZS28_007757 [Streblomastix strix]